MTQATVHRPARAAAVPTAGGMELRTERVHRRLTPSLVALAFALGAASTAASAQDAPPAPPAGATDSFQIPSEAVPQAPAAAPFEIRAFAVRGNTVLAADTVERAIYRYTGPGKTSTDVEGARAALQKAFEDAGYIAVSVFVPEQGTESGLITLEVQPQAIGQVLVEGAKNPDAVRAQAPSLTPGRTPNLPEFQRDVVAMNQLSSRRVTPELRAGTAPGTLDVLLKVEETSAFHASTEVNNFSSAATTDLRVSGTLRYDNMWGRGDSLSISAQTAPRRSDDGTVLSGNYMMRLGQGTQLLLYAVHSDSDIAVVGGTSVIGRGNIFGGRLIQALGSSEGFYHSLTLGVDWKDFLEDVRLGADRNAIPIQYLPVTASWRGDWSGDKQNSNITLSGIFGTRGIGTGGGFSFDGCVEDVDHFDCKRYKAKPNFIVLKGEAETTLDIFSDFQVNARFSGQWSPDPLISNEGFSLGGMSSVRGYYESEALADYGFSYQTELRTPNLASMLGEPIDELRFHGFWDMGWGGIHDPLDGQDDRFRLMTVGAGARLRLFKYLNGALDVGTPLISGPDSKSGDIFARFRIWGEF